MNGTESLQPVSGMPDAIKDGADNTHCGNPMIGVEYSFDHPYHWDGVSEWRCQTCGVRIGRWSKRVLVADEFESCRRPRTIGSEVKP